MLFSIDITAPANTPATAPVEQEVQLPPGIIHRVHVQFPGGCVGLVHTRVMRGAHQVWPTNPAGDLSSDGRVIEWDDDYELDAAPFALTLQVWNLDDFFNHTVTWRFAMREFAPTLQQLLEAQLAAQSLQTLEVGP